MSFSTIRWWTVPPNAHKVLSRHCLRSVFGRCFSCVRQGIVPTFFHCMCALVLHPAMAMEEVSCLPHLPQARVVGPGRDTRMLSFPLVGQYTVGVWVSPLVCISQTHRGAMNYARAHGQGRDWRAYGQFGQCSRRTHTYVTKFVAHPIPLRW